MGLAKHQTRFTLPFESRKSAREKQRSCGAASAPLLQLLRRSGVGTGSARVMSSRTLVNTKRFKIFEVVIEAFLGEPETTFLKVSLAPFFLWAVAHVADNGNVSVNTANCFPVPGRGEEWGKGFMWEDPQGLVWYPEGSLPGNDKNRGAGRSWEAGRAQQAAGVPLLLL